MPQSSSHVYSRIQEDIKRELGAIIFRLNDPRITGKIISVVKVNLSGDMKICNIYISCVEGLPAAKEAAKALGVASGHIKKQISKRIGLRFTPALNFFANDSIEYGAAMLEKIKKVNHQTTGPKKVDQ